MKVLLISAYFPLKLDDSARSFVCDEAFELSKAGVDVYVARWRSAGRFLVQWVRLLMGLTILSLLWVLKVFPEALLN